MQFLAHASLQPHPHQLVLLICNPCLFPYCADLSARIGRLSSANLTCPACLWCVGQMLAPVRGFRWRGVLNLLSRADILLSFLHPHLLQPLFLNALVLKRFNPLLCPVCSLVKLHKGHLGSVLPSPTQWWRQRHHWKHNANPWRLHTPNHRHNLLRGKWSCVM